MLASFHDTANMKRHVKCDIYFFIYMDGCLIRTYLMCQFLQLAIIGKPKMPSLTLVVVLLILILSYNIADGDDEQQESCSRRCGVHNISHSFRLKDSPEECGDKRYILSCEDNNQLILHYECQEYHGKYHVRSINYKNCHFTCGLTN